VAKKRRKKAEEALLLALACGATVEGAARQAGLSERTAYRRLADPEFKRRQQDLRGDMVQRAAGALTAASAEAVRALLEVLRSSMAGDVRLRAARSILEMGLRLRESVELTERMAAVERELEALLAQAGRPEGAVGP
jgi:hypothetical protein